ncbi:hypothetical protein XANCAGTX0491_009154 [Xanthoria calcicola]
MSLLLLGETALRDQAPPYTTCCGPQVEESWSRTGNGKAVFYLQPPFCSFALIAIKDGLGPSYSPSCPLKSLDRIPLAQITQQLRNPRLHCPAGATLESPVLRPRILLPGLPQSPPSP